MATDKFIPQIWSARILDVLDKNLVYARLFNQDYEGEITQAGDTVKIGMIGDVTVKDYTKNTDIAAPDDVDVTEQTLTIDQSKYFNIAVDDVDAVQSAVNLLNEATDRAGFAFLDVCDQFLAKTLATAATATSGLGTKATPITITADNAYETVVKMKTALDKANLPKAGRICVVPPEFEGFMLMDSRFVAVGTAASNDRLEQGTVYRAAGFEIAVSNNAPSAADGGSGSTTVYNVLASAPTQGTFAQQILKTEAYRPEKRFADAVKGLHVYGAKVLRPQVVANATVAF